MNDKVTFTESRYEHIWNYYGTEDVRTADGVNPHVSCSKVLQKEEKECPAK